MVSADAPMQTARVVEMLETDLQVPVVHATICEAWQIHKRLSVRETAVVGGAAVATANPSPTRVGSVGADYARARAAAG
jgi:maleate cis-trans isomerase